MMASTAYSNKTLFSDPVAAESGQSHDANSKPHHGDDGFSSSSQSVHHAYSAPLHRKLKSRHLQMIAIGGKSQLKDTGSLLPKHVQGTDLDAGIIGPGLLVSSGNALHNGGPAGILISFSLVGMIVYNVM